MHEQGSLMFIGADDQLDTLCASISHSIYGPYGNQIVLNGSRQKNTGVFVLMFFRHIGIALLQSIWVCCAQLL